MNNENSGSSKQKRQIWAGILSLLAILLSFHLHDLYGRLHWPGPDRQNTVGGVLEILHLDSFIAAVFGLGLSVLCMVKGNKILGILAIVLSMGALINSIIFF